MKKIRVIIDRAGDGTYNVYCEEQPLFFGLGSSIEEAKRGMIESIRLTKDELGKEKALIYPEWLDEGYEFD